MKIEQTFSIDAPRQVVWDFVKDTGKMTACIPGCEKIEVVDDKHYKAAVKIKVGPISAKFNLDIEILEESPPTEIISRTRGEEGTRASTISADNIVRLTEKEDGSTDVYCLSESSIVGRLGKYGAGMMKKKADAIWGKLAENIRREIENTEQKI
jgi:carbon monoxide dehydrogenase subunit G